MLLVQAPWALDPQRREFPPRLPPQPPPLEAQRHCTNYRAPRPVPCRSRNLTDLGKCFPRHLCAWPRGMATNRVASRKCICRSRRRRRHGHRRQSASPGPPARGNGCALGQVDSRKPWPQGLGAAVCAPLGCPAMAGAGGTTTDDIQNACVRGTGHAAAAQAKILRLASCASIPGLALALGPAATATTVTRTSSAS